MDVESLVDGIRRATDVMMSGKLDTGFGDVGKERSITKAKWSKSFNYRGRSNLCSSGCNGRL